MYSQLLINLKNIMTIENLLEEYRELKKKFNISETTEIVNSNSQKPHPFEIGKNYFIRTVTMILIGKLEEVYDNELILSTPAWIPDTGRFSKCLKDGEEAINEIEPFQDNIIIGRNSIIDATIWNHRLLTEVK